MSQTILAKYTIGIWTGKFEHFDWVRLWKNRGEFQRVLDAESIKIAFPSGFQDEEAERYVSGGFTGDPPDSFEVNPDGVKELLIDSPDLIRDFSGGSFSVVFEPGSKTTGASKDMIALDIETIDLGDESETILDYDMDVMGGNLEDVFGDLLDDMVPVMMSRCNDRGNGFLSNGFRVFSGLFALSAEMVGGFSGWWGTEDFEPVYDFLGLVDPWAELDMGPDRIAFRLLPRGLTGQDIATGHPVIAGDHSLKEGN